MKKFVFSDNTPFKSGVLFVAIGIFLAPALLVQAQIVVGNQNLIVNGNAEAGTAATSSANPVPIPGWTVSGNATVLPYDLSGYLLLSDPAPPDHGFQYFYAGNVGSGPSTLTQTIDISSAASVISAGNVKFTASAYLGGVEGNGHVAQVVMAFQNAAGQTFSSLTLGPMAYPGTNGMSLQQNIGLVPSGTMHITVTLSFNGAYASADSLSLVLSTLGTTPAAVLGANLLVNPGAESGPGATPSAVALYIPGWSTAGDLSVAPYGGTGWISLSDPGPTDRGVNVFCKVVAGPDASMYQDIDVSPAATLIDSGKAGYQVSAWLGGLSGTSSPTLVYTFFDWSGNQLAATAQLGPARHSGTSLVETSSSGTLPAGTRRVHIEVDFFASTLDTMADNLSFIVGNANAPIVLTGGVVPVFSSATTVESGSWVSIYGTGLAASTDVWTGNFPASLGNTSVTIDGNPAYLWFVSPTQINLQVPDDAATGTVSVVVTTAAGSFASTVNLGPYAPSFSLYNAKYVVAIAPTPGEPGNSGNGYDYIGPSGGLPFPSRPARAGETLLLFGVGFGPTNPVVHAGQIFSGAAPAVTLPTVTIGGVSAAVGFAGIVEAGLFQLNVVVPAAGSGDQTLEATVGGVTTQANVFLTLQ
jgi:uncharacterized protein (TIGR03437 family)